MMYGVLRPFLHHFKSYRDDGRVIMKYSVQLSAVQSRANSASGGIRVRDLVIRSQEHQLLGHPDPWAPFWKHASLATHSRVAADSPISILSVSKIQILNYRNCPNYWDNLTPYHIYTENLKIPFYYLLMCL